MAQCTPRYLSLCQTPKVQLRDGEAGANAKIYIPFFGFYFASGETLTAPGSTIPQNNSFSLSGVTRCSTGSVNTACGSCQ